MAKLYFRHGSMGSAKTLLLLAVAHNYRAQGKAVLILKPALDDRFGREKVRSRAGIEKDADMLIEHDTLLNFDDFEGISCVLVDEVQFLSPDFIDQLRELSRVKDIPVICYGLRTNFKTYLFDGSKRMMELADSIEEIKTTCYYCNSKAIMNLKHVNGLATNEGPAIQLGAEESYFPVCYKCYVAQLEKAKDAKTHTGCGHEECLQSGCRL